MFDNLDKMSQFLEKQNLKKITQEEIDKPIRSVKKSVSNNLSIQKRPSEVIGKVDQLRKK